MSAARQAALAMLKNPPSRAAAWWDRLDPIDREFYVRGGQVLPAVSRCAWADLSDSEKKTVEKAYHRARLQFIRLRAQFERLGAAGVAG